MKKKVISLVIILVIILSFSAYALEQWAAVVPSLSISGTTATCGVTISQAEADIDVTLELWCGKTFIDSWSTSGRGYAKIRETCKVSRGNTYTLIASGTIDGEPFESAPVEKTCK